MKKSSLLYIVVLTFSFLISWKNAARAQKSTIDSLHASINNSKPDTIKVERLIDLTNQYFAASRYDTAINFGSLALELAKELEYEKGMITSFNLIGEAYSQEGDYPKAIENYLNALSISEKRNDSISIAHTWGNLGDVYRLMNNFSVSFEYLKKALAISKTLQNKNQTFFALLNTGNLYFSMKKYDEALPLYAQALEIAYELKNKINVAIIFTNLGAVYFNQKNFPKTLDYDLKALEIYKDLNMEFEQAVVLANIGEVYASQKKYDEAEKMMLKALEIDIKTGAFPNIKYVRMILRDLYLQTGNYKEAYEQYNEAEIIKDSLFNLEKDKEITRRDLNYEFDKKERAIKAENEKQRLLREAKAHRQQIISWTVGGGLLLMLLFLAFVFRSLRITRKQKNIIEQQKNEVVEQKGIVEKQKEIVDRKQKETIDSINYAKRIQQALLASEDVLQQSLPEYFVLYMPKDIVSGDFYWADKTNQHFLMAVCDCTGHGVPGAFMSLLNITKLNETVRERNIIRPDLILNEVRKDIIKVLNPEGIKEEGKDGMDAILCSFDFHQMKLEYACANNPVLIVREGALIECTADKMPVGMHHGKMPDFKLNVFDLKKGDCIYMFTDGYADQFGGPKGKKFKYAHLKETILSVHKMPVKEQQLAFQDIIESWKGNLEQVDDILVIGIRI